MSSLGPSLGGSWLSLKEKDIMKHQIVELHKFNARQNKLASELENEKSLLEETNAGGFEQYEALLKEFEKGKKGKGKNFKRI